MSGYKSKKNKSVMKHDFSRIPKAEIQRSRFDRSHGHKTTMDAGLLVPIYVDEALPGDTFTLDATVFGRMATPAAPIMDNAKMDVHFFAVPLRLLWDNFEKFMGSQDNPNDSTDYLIPQVVWTGDDDPVESQTIHDYLGLPLGFGTVANQPCNALHHRAYNLIYNEWYRDQNLQDSIPVNTGDGPDTPTDYELKRRGKRADYFTSCLPWPQKGPGVEIPLGAAAPVVMTATNAPWIAYKADGTNVSVGGAITHDSDGYVEGAVSAPLKFDPDGTLEADLSNATAADINTLRQAFQLQKMYERDARGGTRYTEVVQAHFNVTSPDARLQRPEYLGGGKVDVNISPIADTTGYGSELGSLGAAGTLAGSGIRFKRSFTEHMVIIGLASITCDLTYQQGLNRMFSRRTRFDYFWPALAHLGEQAVMNKEIYCDGSANDEAIFGYQERYAEYRHCPSRISGKFRSTDPQSLDVWHYSQEFDTLPTLSESFIEENPPIDRVVLVPSEPNFIFDSYFRLFCDRPMPTYSVPGMIDHF